MSNIYKLNNAPGDTQRDRDETINTRQLFPSAYCPSQPNAHTSSLRPLVYKEQTSLLRGIENTHIETRHDYFQARHSTRKHTKNQKKFYKYVHYNSAHSRKLYKGIIQGECIRYVRTNSLTSNYYATITLLQQTLLQRGYPKQLINKTMKTIKRIKIDNDTLRDDQS